MFSKVRLWGGNARLGALGRTLATVRFPEGAPAPPKPLIGQFSGPLLHTFLIASTVYISLQSVWLALECGEKKEELLVRERVLEAEIQALVDEKRALLAPESWWRGLRLWRK